MSPPWLWRARRVVRPMSERIPHFVRRTPHLALLGAALFGATGCIPELTDNPTRDVRKSVPTSFATDAETVPSPGSIQDDPGQLDWREHFKSPELQTLIEAALNGNQELSIRQQEVFLTQAEVMARRGEYLPRLNAQVGAGGEKASEFTSRGYSDKATGLSSILGDFSFGLRSSWEIDVWGKLRKAAAAADRRYLASQEARNFIVTQIIGEIARTYYELLALDTAIDVLQHTIEVQNSAIEVAKAEKEAGRTTERAVQRFQAEVLKNQARLFDLRQEVVQGENRINFLAGRYPQRIERHAALLQEVLPAQLSAGLPSQLLENRPDVRQAALELEASQLDVESARVAFLPSLSLEAGLGYRAFDPKHLLFTPESIVADLAGNLMAPLLNRSGIEAQYRSANAKQIQAVYNYERALLQGYTDTVSRLARYQNLQQSFDLLNRQVDLLTQAVDTTTLLFRNARAEYMEVLFTRRDLLEAQMELIETKKRLLLTTVDVYEALGGGWRRAPRAAATPAAPATTPANASHG